jgi:pimeloyl-ACP methyl ester carboxylesterase
VRFDFGDGIDRLALMDTKYGYWGMLLPSGVDKYLMAPSRSGRFPADVHIDFKRDASGNARGLTMTVGAAQPVAAIRIDAYDSRAITFSNGSITLAGDILRPRSSGSHAAIVMVHSSGNQSRNGPAGYFRLIANVLAANGFAVLVYDKRGVGKSTGSWPNATFEDLAGDVRAAVAALRAEPDVDKDNVGLWTLSQGGWIAPMVAVSDPRIAFLTLVSGAATSPARQEMDRVAGIMRTNGFNQRDIDSAQRYLRTFFDVVTGRQSWGALQALIPGVASEAWASYVPRPQSERDVGWSPAPADLDPQPLLRKITVPVLTLHGADDADVPAEVNASLYSAVSLHSLSRQRIFDRADHYMLLSVGDPDREYRRLDPAYLQSTVEWLRGVSRK